MKRVVSSIWGNSIDYDPKDGWTDEDIALHQSIDWSARNWEDYPIPDDTFLGTATLYCDGGPVQICTKFIKYLRANPIYPPYYAPADRKPFSGYRGYVGPMYDGTTYHGYNVHDRFESQDIYDMMSR